MHRRGTFLILCAGFLGAGLLGAGCGGKAVIDPTAAGGAGGHGAGGATTTTPTTSSSAVVCGGRDFCSCLDEPACAIVYGDCICDCDYACPGSPPCECDCGGGPYFGCAPASCPGPFGFAATDAIGFDEDGCPYLYGTKTP